MPEHLQTNVYVGAQGVRQINFEYSEVQYNETWYNRKQDLHIPEVGISLWWMSSQIHNPDHD